MSRVNRPSVRFAAFLAGLALCSAASALAAGVPGNQYFTVGGGGGMQTFQQPCPDIPCNGGDVCSCITSTGSIKFTTIEQTLPQIGSYTLEVSADNSTATNNGSGGLCYFATGTLAVTTVKGTLTVPFSGPACRIGVRTTTPYGISAAAYIASGTGKYNNPAGTGTFSGTFNPSSQTVLIDLVGYGILHQ